MMSTQDKLALDGTDVPADISATEQRRRSFRDECGLQQASVPGQKCFVIYGVNREEQILQFSGFSLVRTITSLDMKPRFCF